MPEPRQPQDHKKKTGKAKEQPECFTFAHDGQEYVFKPTYDVLTPGFLRRNRRRDDVDQMFTMFEALADEDTLAVIDVLSRSEFKQLTEDFFGYMEMTPGE